MTAPDRIYCDTYLGNPMYAYKNDYDRTQTLIQYIRADKVNAALFQLKSIQAYLDVMHKDNVFLRAKVQAAINQLEL